MTDALAAISLRIGELEAKLAISPIYHELTILSRARDDLRKKLSDSSTGRVKEITNPSDVGLKRVTILEGARLALTETGHPMTTAELVENLPQFGAKVGGKNPRLNLTSVLSKRGDAIVSMRWRSKHTWWFRDRPLPDETKAAEFPLSGNETRSRLSDQLPVSTSATNQGESNASTLADNPDRL